MWFLLQMVKRSREQLSRRPEQVSFFKAPWIAWVCPRTWTGFAFKTIFSQVLPTQLNRDSSPRLGLTNLKVLAGLSFGNLLRTIGCATGDLFLPKGNYILNMSGLREKVEWLDLINHVSPGHNYFGIACLCCGFA